MFTAPYQELLEALRELCSDVGAAILSHYHSGEAVQRETKSDNSPLTAADLDAHALLIDGLEQFGLPVLSEESAAADIAARGEWERYWLVDPLDGTREFLERTGEFTVNIALVVDNRATFGMVAVPMTQAVYAGVPGEGAWRHLGGSWSQIHCRSVQDHDALVVLTSRRHGGAKLNTCLDALCRRKAGICREFVGSALKFCLLAEGYADFYPRFSPCSEWDTAAGQAVLEGAGGAVIDETGRPLTYNTRESLLNPHFLALADAGNPVWKLVWGTGD